MWIPTKIYEALPAIYFAIGLALIGGSAYIGINHGSTLGYFVLGVVCVGAAILIAFVRQNVRSIQNRSRS